MLLLKGSPSSLGCRDEEDDFPQPDESCLYKGELLPSTQLCVVFRPVLRAFVTQERPNNMTGVDEREKEPSA